LLPTIEGAVEARIRIVLFLAGDAAAHASHRLTARFGYWLAAVLAIGAADATGHGEARVFDRVGNALIDLVLHRAVA